MKDAVPGKYFVIPAEPGREKWIGRLIEPLGTTRYVVCFWGEGPSRKPIRNDELFSPDVQFFDTAAEAGLDAPVDEEHPFFEPLPKR